MHQVPIDESRVDVARDRVGVRVKVWPSHDPLGEPPGGDHAAYHPPNEVRRVEQLLIVAGLELGHTAVLSRGRRRLAA